MEILSPRRAVEADFERLDLLYTEFHMFHVLGVSDRLRPLAAPDERADKDVNTLRVALQNILHSEDAALFVVEVDDRVVGFAEVYLRQEEEQPLVIAHRYGYLQSLMVSAPYRKLGLGEALVKVAQQWAKEQGASEMQIETWEFAAGPVPFYEHLGYRTLKRHMVVDLL